MSLSSHSYISFQVSDYFICLQMQIQRSANKHRKVGNNLRLRAYLINLFIYSATHEDQKISGRLERYQMKNGNLLSTGMPSWKKKKKKPKFIHISFSYNHTSVSHYIHYNAPCFFHILDFGILSTASFKSPSQQITVAQYSKVILTGNNFYRTYL